MHRREDWTGVVEEASGLHASSDRLLSLDGWGLETTRRLLRPGIVDPFVP
jgi:alpha-galactosidase